MAERTAGREAVTPHESHRMEPVLTGGWQEHSELPGLRLQQPEVGPRSYSCSPAVPDRLGSCD